MTFDYQMFRLYIHGYNQIGIDLIQSYEIFINFYYLGRKLLICQLGDRLKIKTMNIQRLLGIVIIHTMAQLDITDLC